jgi:hypothetical protein
MNIGQIAECAIRIEVNNIPFLRRGILAVCIRFCPPVNADFILII